MPRLEGYRAWLVDKGYQPSTIDATLRHLKVVAKDPAALMYRGPHIRRYLLFVEDTQCNPLGRKFTKHMLALGLKAAADTRKGGAHTKDLLTRPEWSKLNNRLRKGGRDLDLLICAYMHSMLRVSEFLGQSLPDIQRSLTNDSASATFWLRNAMRDQFINPRGKRVYQLLCPSSRCAYSRMRRRLAAIATDLNIEVDLNTVYKTHQQREAA